MSLPVPIDPPSSPASDPHARWRFLRDVAVFEFKLVLNNLHNFVQVPLTLVVALIDLVFRPRTEGARFYKLLEYGRTIDEAIDIYSVIEHHDRSLNKDFTVDAVVTRLEQVIVREYEKGGTAASIKAALDSAIDELQARAGKGRDGAAEAMRRTAEKLREKMDRDRPTA